MNLSMADLSNYWTEFHETWWSYTYHYVKFYVSVIIYLEIININVRNFNFPIGFYSNPHPLLTPQNTTLTPFTTKLKTLVGRKNSTLSDIIKIWYVGR
jgi:hypothetical protein